MNKTEFLEKIKKVIDCETDLDENTNLSELEEWDSIAMISTAAFLDTIGKKVSSAEIKNITSIKELMEKAGINE